MRIARRRLDIGMVECLLYELQVASLAQELGPQIVTKVMKAKGFDPCPRPSSPPLRLSSVECDRIPLAFNALASCVQSAVGEHKEGMIAHKRSQDRPDLIR